MTRTDRMPRVWRPVWVEHKVHGKWCRILGEGPFRARTAALRRLDSLQVLDPTVELRISPPWMPL